MHTIFTPLPRLPGNSPNVTGNDTISHLVTLPGSKTYHALHEVSRFRARYSGGTCGCCLRKVLKDQPVAYDHRARVIIHLWCYNHAQHQITPELIKAYKENDNAN